MMMVRLCMRARSSHTARENLTEGARAVGDADQHAGPQRRHSGRQVAACTPLVALQQ